jgi:hypothetical protein
MTLVEAKKIVQATYPKADVFKYHGAFYIAEETTSSDVVLPLSPTFLSVNAAWIDAAEQIQRASSKKAQTGVLYE